MIVSSIQNGRFAHNDRLSKAHQFAYQNHIFNAATIIEKEVTFIHEMIYGYFDERLFPVEKRKYENLEDEEKDKKKINWNFLEHQSPS